MKTRTRGVYDSEGRRKYLSGPEGEKFHQYAASLPKPRAQFCLTIYYTGCRISEALNLKRSDIDLEMNVISIRSLKKRGKIVVRRIPLPEFLIRQLWTLVPDESQRFWQFSRITGWRIIKQAMEDLGISGVHATAKGLRHAFGIRAVLVRLPVSLIQYWLGHSHPSTTAIYLEAKDEEARELIARMWPQTPSLKSGASPDIIERSILGENSTMIVTVHVPDYFAKQFHLDDAAHTRQLLEAFVLQRFADGNLTSGQVGDALGLSFHETEQFLHDHNAPADVSAEEHLEQMKNLEQILRQ